MTIPEIEELIAHAVGGDRPANPAPGKQERGGNDGARSRAS